MFLLDTNVISEMIKPNPDQGVMKKLKRYEKALFTAAPVWHELIFGYQRLPDSPKKQRIGTFLDRVVLQTIKILPYNMQAAQWHGQERAKLSAQGVVPPFVDGQIAGVAFVNGLTLVTRNTRDFNRFSNLSLENWWR